MVPLLVTISLILHVVAFFWIRILSLKIKGLNDSTDNASTNVQQEIEDVLQTYLTEIKDENEKLLNRIEKSGNTNSVVQTAPTSKAVKQDEPKTTIKKPPTYKPKTSPTKSVKPLPKKTIPSQVETNKVDRNQQGYQPPQPSKGDEFVPSITSQVFLLHEKGFTPNQIAQKLNKGKTEIELLLKFRPESKENT